MTIFGTRPEAIKMAPLIKKLEASNVIESIVCVTAQHREMLDQVLNLFKIMPNYDLNIMKSGQNLSDITARVLKGLEEVIEIEHPDLILVHGDTTTTFAGALSAFYHQIPVGHVEAGLRSGNPYSPFPEEMNRKMTGSIASLHFAATKGNVANLLNEGVSESDIVQTGNTVIDALKMVIGENYLFKEITLNKIPYEEKFTILMTAHRRENMGDPMNQIFSAIRKIVDEFEQVELIFPMHLNPKIRAVAKSHFASHERIHLIEPLEYEDFANLQNKVKLILTDSGGVQEEAPALGKPVIVLRTETERPEAVEAGTVIIAGTDQESVYTMTKKLITDRELYNKMSEAVNPYGDGYASDRIVSEIEKRFAI